MQDGYTNKTMVNKLGALNNLSNTEYKNNTNVRDHVAHLQS